MNNVFLVKSPLQLLNAIEAKHYFQLDDSKCWLLVMGDRKSYSQLMKLVQASKQWSNVVLINRVGLLASSPWSVDIDFDNLDKQRKTLLRSSMFTIWRLNRLVRTIGEVQYVFLGDNNNAFMRHFSNSVKHDSTVLLDDGTATLDVARQRMQGEVRRKPDRFSKKLRLAAKRLLQGLKDYQVDKVSFFTAYKIDVKPPDQVINNNFGWLRQKSGSLQSSESIYFLGSPLSEVGLMSEKSYLDQLGMVRSQYGDRDFVYVAHRRESRDKLKLVEQQLKIRTCLFEYPVEYQFSMIGPRPAMVLSFITSALDNLHLILGDSIHIIAYRMLDGSYASSEKIEAIYDHYQSSSCDSFQLKALG